MKEKKNEYITMLKREENKKETDTNSVLDV